MRSKHSFKRIAALVLSGAMVLGTVPLPGMTYEAHAETVTDTTSMSPVAYATVDQLKAVPTVDGNDYDGDITKVARLLFGEVPGGGLAKGEWYILGADSEVGEGDNKGNNIAIFSAYDLATDQPYKNDTANSIWNSSYGTYDSTTTATEMVEGSSEIYANHYGASALRETMKSLETSMFDFMEQEYLQETPLRNSDWKNGKDDWAAFYTLSDKLYAPAGWMDDDYGIYIGSGSDEGDYGRMGSLEGSKPISYASLGDNMSFILRSASQEPGGTRVASFDTAISYIVNSDSVTVRKAVRAATNIDLSNVLFASAVRWVGGGRAFAIQTVDNSTTDTKDPMVLRVKPPTSTDAKKLGTVTYDAGEKTITVNAGEYGGYLVVQGKYTPEGSSTGTDWYYTLSTGENRTTTITATDIATAIEADSAVSLAGSTTEERAACINLDECAIWIEQPFDWSADQQRWDLRFAVQATEPHEHSYPTSTDSTSPDYWNGHDGASHWQECTDTDCPDKDGSKRYEQSHIQPQEWTKEDGGSEHWKVCSVCGEKITSTVAVHSPYNWNPTEDKTQHTGTCECGYTVTEAHDFSVHKSDDTYHWNECSKCGYKDPSSKEKHTFVDSDDDTDGDCTDDDCNYNLYTGHDLRWVDRKEPTCDEVGYEGHWECDNAEHSGEIFIKNELGLIVFTDLDSITIPATGHTAGETYVKIDDTYDAPVCEDCGEPITDRKELHDLDENGICQKEGCDYDKNASDHTHVYDETVWKRNATYHWHQCTDANCPDASGSIIDKTTHTYSGRKCTVCGYTKSSGGSGGGGGSNTGASGVSSGTGSGAGVSGTWHQDEKGWWFEYIDGSYAHGSLETNEDGSTTMYVAWVKTGGKWYAFDADGYMVKDWLYDAESGYWYYCDADNGLQKGWLYTPVDNCWYYLDPVNGKMHTAWSLIDGKYYYFSEMHNGTYYQDPATGKWIYLNLAALRPLGSMYAATLTPDGCLVGADGAYIEQ